ncbi:unnamed protein product [Didymodactylos carnosus]|uniref:Uncharacterized protein n=1 Tax=Didymodactylos carnosus TaxID=1234261 RepID=A0A815SRG7_9BILA|nr:unnamed protein product [Didymodactylos carnosus]CAF1494290.1 unnamed protein product [Didymodactylos carnosus]CAF4217828.1 unnamed protein product [Didymodactylos carnosus]CAF4356967.1 unnamed protein product [Didymodactylos carnosus]
MATTTTSSGSFIVSTFNGVLSIATIIGIVVGALAGLAILIGIIITLICLCKPKRQVGGVILPPSQTVFQPYGQPMIMTSATGGYPYSQQWQTQQYQQNMHIPQQRYQQPV